MTKVSIHTMKAITQNGLMYVLLNLCLETKLYHVINHMVKFCLQTKIQQHIHQPILGYRLHRVYGNLCHSTTILSNQYHSGQTIKTNFINNSAPINSVADWVCCKWPEWLGKISGCVVQVLEPHSLHVCTRQIIRCPYRCLSGPINHTVPKVRTIAPQ